MSELLIEHSDTGITQLTLNRPDKLNALNASLIHALTEALIEVKQSPRTRVVILTGQGKAFCAGADITQLQDANRETGLAFARQGQECFNQLESLGKPVIAALNGYAFGGGCELAMAATLRVASSQAVLGQPEIKLGVIPGYGGTQRLSRLVGKGRAMELCLTGRQLSAEEALQWGLINELVDADTLATRSMALAKDLAGLAPQALKAIMETINLGYDKPLADALALEASTFAEICETQDCREGVDAFLNKRSAQFTGQ